jgi:DNA-binding transcriptional ArsR family regulator
MQNINIQENIIKLETKEQLKIYIDPVRQQLLRVLGITGYPMTPKTLSDKLSISPSSVQYHLKKLLTLGVVKIHHTELINGITASYYSPIPATVQICVDNCGYSNEKRALLLQLVNNVLSGFMESMEKHEKSNKSVDSLRKYGDIMTGIAYLSENERIELFSQIDKYIKNHEQKKENTSSWEYAVVLYNASEDNK